MSVQDNQKLQPVPFTQVRIADQFWEKRLRVNRERTLPCEYRQCKETGRIEALKLAWKPGQPNKPHIYWDSDVAKWIEAASYSLAAFPDARLDARLDQVIGLIARAQQPDGYLNSHYTTVEPEKRWTNLRDCHELYCAGNLIEAAAAHFQATGKRTLLEVMCRYADYIGSVFGPEPGKKRGYCGHEEIELALIKLYRATGEKKYLKLSEYFVNERGRQPHYFDLEAKARGENPRGYWAETYSYLQAHEPVRKQTRVTGHAVRAMYLYCAMADLAGELGERSLLAAGRRLWRHATEKLMYITGGLGSSGHNEGFTFDYDLPNETAYCETCAAIGFVFWNHRLLQLDCDGRYADVLERALHNNVLAGVSLDGEKFFYENPLASVGKHHRQEWFGCACCPPNIARLLASLGQYAYSRNAHTVAVHLYAQGTAKFQLAGQQVALRQETNYPWDGKVRLKLELEREAAFTLKLRIPGWCEKATLALNGKNMALKTAKGYATIQRKWRGGDKVDLALAMPVQRLYAHPKVRMNCGRVALQRGPLVYCLEGVDNGPDLNALALPKKAKFKTKFEKNLLQGVVTLSAKAQKISTAGRDGQLYQAKPGGRSTVEIKAVPYCTWDNRAPGEMLVWIREANGA